MNLFCFNSGYDATWTYSDTRRTAFHHSIRNSGTRRVDHGDEASKAKSRRGEVHFICVETVATRKLLLIQVQVTET